MADSETFVYGGAPEFFTVPDDVTAIEVEVFGAAGGADSALPYGGLGARVAATVPVTPGEVLQVNVGGQGTVGVGGFNGGGAVAGGYGGGGGSDIRRAGARREDRIVVAGGGGGAGTVGGTVTSPVWGAGGSGGSPNGTAGSAGFCGIRGALGGTQTAGGAPSVEGSTGQAGGFGYGGGGSPHSSTFKPGSGGGGYYGGGGGHVCTGGAPGGGGGSSYVLPGGSGVVMAQGVRRGNGLVHISWPPTEDPLPGLIPPTSQSFSATGAPQWFTVPDGVIAVQVDVRGGGGGGTDGGDGGRVVTTVAVAPGDVLQVNVGGAGGSSTSAFNGGGFTSGGQGGGGASDIRRNGARTEDRIVVAGAGGGATGAVGGADGGDGGFPNGGDGQAGACGYPGATGGSQTAGGTPVSLGSNATSGGAGFGGNGQNYGAIRPGAGGAGYFGGGGARSCNPAGSPGGGGGSSWVTPASLNTSFSTGVNDGAGSVTISWPVILLPDRVFGFESYGEYVNNVHVGSGNMVERSRDAVVSTTGPPLAVDRTYNSFDPRDGMFGLGWSTPFETQAIADPSSGDVVIIRGDGRREGYFSNGNGTFDTPVGYVSTLISTVGGGWLLTDKDGTVHVFDTAGRLVSIADRYGRTLSLTYTAGEVSSVTDVASGRSLTFAYTAGHVTQVSTPTVSGPGYSGALVWNYTYDAGRLTAACDPRDNNTSTGSCTRYEYDPGNRLNRVVRPEGNDALQVGYNLSTGRVAWTENGADARVTYTYTPGVTLVTDPRTFATSYFYDGLYRTTQITDAAAGVTNYTYNADGFRDTVTDPLGHTVTMTYDANGNMTSSTDPLGHTEWFTYDVNSNVIEHRDARSGSSTDATFLTTSTYNADRDRLTETTPPTPDHPTGVTSTWAYSAGTENHGWGTIPAGLVLTYNSGYGPATQYAYDSDGDLRRMTDPSGMTTDYTHDSLGRTTSTVVSWDNAASSATTTQAWDQMGNLVEVTEPATTNVVAAAAEVHQRRTVSVYDANSNRVTETVSDVGGSANPSATRATSFEFDAADRNWRTTDPEGGVESLTFDANSNVVSTTDANGRVFESDYDELNRVTDVRLVGFRDDPIGASAPRTVVLARYGHDAAGQVTSSFSPAPGTGAWPGQLSPATPMVETRIGYDDAGRQLTTTVIGFHNRAGVSPATRDIVTEARTYDAVGNVVTVAGGNATSLVTNTYDAMSRVQSSVAEGGALDRVTTYDYNAKGLPTHQTIARGGSVLETVTAYNDAGWPVSVAVANGAADALVTTYGYDQRGLRTSMVGPRGNVAGADPADFETSYTYDAVARLVRQQDPEITVEVTGGAPSVARPTVEYGFDAVGNEIARRGARGSVTTVAYDRLNRQTVITHPTYTPPGGGGAVTPTESYMYDAVGNVTSSTDRRGHTTDYTFDARNRVVRRLDPQITGQPARGSTTVRYDDAGHTVQVTNPIGATTRATHDDLGRPRTGSSVVSVAGSTQTYTSTFDYDDLGNQTLVIDATGVVTTSAYDALSQMVSVTDGAGQSLTYTYEVSGQVASSTDPLGRSTHNFFDGAGRTIRSEQRDPAGTAVSTSWLTYDATGNVVGSRSPRSSGAGDDTYLTSYVYNEVGQLVSVTAPVSAGVSMTSSYAYDAGGNLTRFTDGRGETTTYTYQPWNLLESTVEPATSGQAGLADRTFTTSYDPAGLPVVEALPGVTITREFDQLGSLLEVEGAPDAGVTGAAAATKTFGRDLIGQMTSMAHPAGTVGFTWDERGLLTAVTAPGTTTTESLFEYDPAGRMVSRADVAGVTEFGYDNRGLLASWTEPLTGLTAVFARNNAGQVDSVTYDSATPASRLLTYDGIGRLVSDTVTVNAAVVNAAGYSYDPSGNVTAQAITAPGNASAGTHSYSYDRADRLESWTDPASVVTVYVYDGANNRVQAGATAYTYDARNRLTSDGTDTYMWSPRGSMTSDAGTPVVFDALGRQTSHGTVVYSYDDLDRVATRDSEVFSYAGTEIDPVGYGTTERYSRSPSGSLLGVEVDGVASLAGRNRHGDLSWLLDDTGAVTDTRVWDPYGSLDAATGTTAVALGYQADFTDPASGHVNMGARWYVPSTAIFTARDTVFGQLATPVSLNRYTYAAGNPLRYFDPDGHRYEETGSTARSSTKSTGTSGAGSRTVSAGSPMKKAKPAKVTAARSVAATRVRLSDAAPSDDETIAPAGAAAETERGDLDWCVEGGGNVYFESEVNGMQGCYRRTMECEGNAAQRAACEFRPFGMAFLETLGADLLGFSCSTAAGALLVVGAAAGNACRGAAQRFMAADLSGGNGFAAAFDTRALTATPRSAPPPASSPPG